MAEEVKVLVWPWSIVPREGVSEGAAKMELVVSIIARFSRGSVEFP